MTILSTKNETIQFSLSKKIHEKRNLHSYTYTPDLPVVICSDKTNAEYIQSEVNKFVNTLVKTLLNNNGVN